MQKTIDMIPLFIEKLIFSAFIIKKLQEKINNNFAFFLLEIFSGMLYYHISSCIAIQKLKKEFSTQFYNFAYK